MGGGSLLTGRRIDALFVGDDESVLVFNTDEGKIYCYAWGDCCSESWFADIIGVQYLVGHTVVSVEFRDLEPPKEDDGKTRQEYDRFYSIELTTDIGNASIIFRNSSNGYYGGGAGFSDDGKKYNPGKLRRITEDWAA